MHPAQRIPCKGQTRGATQHQQPRRTTGLLALCGSTAIIIADHEPLLAERDIWRGGQGNFRQSRPLLSHFLTGQARAGRRPYVSQNTARGVGSRFASEPALLSASGSQIHRLQEDLNKLPTRSG